MDLPELSRAKFNTILNVNKIFIYIYIMNIRDLIIYHKKKITPLVKVIFFFCRNSSKFCKRKLSNIKIAEKIEFYAWKRKEV